MNLYLVGGAVRDFLLGQDLGDKDWLVVGSTPQDMQSRGFIPVGADFPVFLHPMTKEEYALARTERKTALGYKGFQFYAGQDVTLEQDLSRRDLTINAIAVDRQGRIHDPFHGREDLSKKVLKHVGPAFVEDPVRILRLSRFAAKFSDFELSPETQALCEQMVHSGEVNALQAERVWKEVSRGLLQTQPSRMWSVLEAVGAADIIFGGQLLNCQLLDGLSDAVDLNKRFAMVAYQADLDVLNAVLKLPHDCYDLARLLQRYAPSLSMLPNQASQALSVLLGCDAIRRPERFAACLETMSLLKLNHQKTFWQSCRDAIINIPISTLLKEVEKKDIPHVIEQARLRVIEEVLKKASIHER
ncbi:hypothetical protein IX83_06015 [Basilea psittacipulmonis DSM 24701]|uniref:CCA tRNA nucleotidyltransferase n=1 Tax=Basilea psittacipulmonis DSM 24701 TaxID=1072685 RepID=A0A077DID2_9BURK|nr:hypothetical protein IX83_06015 [Basilea psittacipulmonis DSM 24701]